MSRAMHQASQKLRRKPAHHNLRSEFQLGLEDEIFTPSEIAVRRAQRQSQLLYTRTTTGERDATAGASAPSSLTSSPSASRFYTPYASFSAKRPTRPRPCNINTSLCRSKSRGTIRPAIAKALLALTLNPVKATDTNRAACAESYGQQHLVGEMKFADVQILSRAGNVARARRMRQ